MIKHVSFDLWGTLIEGNPLYKNLRNNLLNATFGRLPYDKEGKSTKQVVDDINELSGKPLDYYQTLVVMLGRTEDTPEQFRKKVRDFKVLNEIVFVENLPTLKEGVWNFLDELREKKVTMSILSNTSIVTGGLLDAALVRLGIREFFEFTLYSDEIGFAKPNPSAFAMVKTYMLRKSLHGKVVHVGDNDIADNASGVMDYYVSKNFNDIKNYLYAACDVLSVPV